MLSASSRLEKLVMSWFEVFPTIKVWCHMPLGDALETLFIQTRVNTCKLYYFTGRFIAPPTRKLRRRRRKRMSKRSMRREYCRWG